MARTYELTEYEAQLVHALVAEQRQAKLNWIASAVESGSHERAQMLVRDLRRLDALFAKTNVTVHREQDAKLGA